MNATLAFSQFDLSMDQSPEVVFSLLLAAQIAVVVITVVIHSACALAVFHDAMKLGTRTRANPNPTATILVGSIVWAGGALLLGIVGLAAYWLVHHSALRVRRTDESSVAIAADAAPVG